MRKLILFTCLAGFFSVALSQEERRYTDEELTQYARVMVWTKIEKDRMTGVYNDWINKNENLDAPKFLKIKQAKGDSIQLEELGISEGELKAYDQIISNYDSMTLAFKEVYIGKIKEDIGAGLYNALKADLKTSPELKARHNAIVTSLKEAHANKEDELEE